MSKEIYTEEFMLQETRRLLKELQKDKSIIYIWELFEDKKYTRQRYNEGIRKFPDNEEIQQNSSTIKEILESRAIKGAMTNKLNATSTIFHLKNNYKWVDKQEIDQNTNMKLSVNLDEASEEELDKIING